ncbi:type IV secretion system DNA-binding domain-containing protein [Candidatus Gracilibacteria bacterium]|nr:type IV secretion system DNA-binding domain-containing protein [Candidatus Gracilibacteria bacterium]
MPTIYVRTPGVNWVTTRRFEPPHNLPHILDPNTPIGLSNFRGSTEAFAIQPIDRARHTYIIGKTGMGKSTLLENMLYSDIMSGRGIALIDPHGDLADTILANIPKSRTNDIVLFDPSDTEYPIAFNMLDNPNPELRPIVASGLVSIFKKMFAESWGPRLEYILRNTILTLLLIPDTTLISIPLMLTHESYRRKVVSKITDPILIQFWTNEFEKMAPAQMSEAINPILNKVGQFLSSPILRNILGQPKNPFSLRWIMDNGKIFIVNLSKGKIGEDASALLGAMMVTKFQIEAMTRADTPEADRRDFGLYVDEFQNFATDSFATILSEARKYKLSLTMANQYIAQMPETVQGAVFGNVGSLISFQVGHDDAMKFAEVFGGEDVITPHDLTNLRKYDIYTKLLIDGMPSPVFSATTYAPLHERIDTPPQQSRDVLLKVSREKYTKKRDYVEKKIFEYAAKISDDEKKYRKEKEEYKEGLKTKKESDRKQKPLE